MIWLVPIGLLGLIGVLALIVIYVIKPNYQQKLISSTYVWKLSLKYKKRRLPINRLQNISQLSFRKHLQQQFCGGGCGGGT